MSALSASRAVAESAKRISGKDEHMKENEEGLELDITIEELESKITPEDNGETVLPL